MTATRAFAEEGSPVLSEGIPRSIVTHSKRVVNDSRRLSTLRTRRHYPLITLECKKEAIQGLQELTISHLLALADCTSVQELSTVKRLVAHRGQIASLDENIFLALPHLEELDLKSNRIRHLPNTIGACAQLQKLVLNGNCLESLPFVLKKCSLLTELHASSNNLTYLHDTLFAKARQLKVLDFDHNQLRTLPPTIGACTAITTISIRHNPLITLPPSLFQLPHLHQLSLDWLRYCAPPYPRRLADGELAETLALFASRLADEHTLNGALIDAGFGPFVASDDGTSDPHKTLPCFPVIILLSKKCVRVSGKKLSKSVPHNLAVDKSKRTRLHVACSEGNVGVVDALIRAGASVHDEDDQNFTPLLHAVRAENWHCAELLLRAGAVVDGGGGIFGSPLHVAAVNTSIEMVVLLFKYKASADFCDRDGNTPLHVLFSVFDSGGDRSVAIALLLLMRGAKCNAVGRDGWAPIHLAARRAQTYAFEFIAECRAVRNRHLAMVATQLIDASPTAARVEHCLATAGNFDIDMRGGSQWWTPLHLASHSGLTRVVLQLIKMGANILKTNISMRTARDVAAGQMETAKTLYRAEKQWLYWKVCGPRLREQSPIMLLGDVSPVAEPSSCSHHDSRSPKSEYASHSKSKSLQLAETLLTPRHDIDSFRAADFLREHTLREDHRFARGRTTKTSVASTRNRTPPRRWETSAVGAFRALWPEQCEPVGLADDHPYLPSAEAAELLGDNISDSDEDSLEDVELNIAELTEELAKFIDTTQVHVQRPETYLKRRIDSRNIPKPSSFYRQCIEYTQRQEQSFIQSCLSESLSDPLNLGRLPDRMMVPKRYRFEVKPEPDNLLLQETSLIKIPSTTTSTLTSALSTSKQPHPLTSRLARSEFNLRPPNVTSLPRAAVEASPSSRKIIFLGPDAFEPATTQLPAPRLRNASKHRRHDSTHESSDRDTTEDTCRLDHINAFKDNTIGTGKPIVRLTSEAFRRSSKKKKSSALQLPDALECLFRNYRCISKATSDVGFDSQALEMLESFVYQKSVSIDSVYIQLNSALESVYLNRPYALERLRMWLLSETMRQALSSRLHMCSLPLRPQPVVPVLPLGHSCLYRISPGPTSLVSDLLLALVAARRIEEFEFVLFRIPLQSRARLCSFRDEAESPLPTRILQACMNPRLADTFLYTFISACPSHPSDWSLPDTRDLDRTVVHMAARRGLMGSLQLILMRGADPNVPDATGSTPLHIAVWSGQSAIVLMLLHHCKVAHMALDNNGRSPLDLAVETGDVQLVAMLINRGYYIPLETSTRPAGVSAADSVLRRAACIPDSRLSAFVRRFLMANGVGDARVAALEGPRKPGLESLKSKAETGSGSAVICLGVPLGPPVGCKASAGAQGPSANPITLLSSKSLAIIPEDKSTVLISRRRLELGTSPVPAGSTTRSVFPMMLTSLCVMCSGAKQRLGTAWTPHPFPSRAPAATERRRSMNSQRTLHRKSTQPSQSSSSSSAGKCRTATSSCRNCSVPVCGDCAVGYRRVACAAFPFLEDLPRQSVEGAFVLRVSVGSINTSVICFAQEGSSAGPSSSVSASNSCGLYSARHKSFSSPRKWDAGGRLFIPRLTQSEVRDISPYSLPSTIDSAIERAISNAPGSLLAVMSGDTNCELKPADMDVEWDDGGTSRTSTHQDTLESLLELNYRIESTAAPEGWLGCLSGLRAVNKRFAEALNAVEPNSQMKLNQIAPLQGFMAASDLWMMERLAAFHRPTNPITQFSAGLLAAAEELVLCPTCSDFYSSLPLGYGLRRDRHTKKSYNR